MATESQIYFGRNILREALAAKAPISEIFYETESAKQFLESLNAIKSQKILLSSGLPKETKNQNHQGVAFKSHHEFYIPYHSSDLKKYAFIILCNQIEDVHNLGSITRCGAGFGATLIIHESKGSAELTAAAVKSSVGLAFRLKFMKVPSLTPVAKDLGQAGFHLVGLDIAKNSVSLFEWIPQFPLALVLGSESDGIDPGLRNRCETLVKIPTEPWVESLNVSHAAAVAMSWIYRSGKGN